MCERTHPALKVVFVVWLVFLHLMFGLLVIFMVAWYQFGRYPDSGASSTPFGSSNEVVSTELSEDQSEKPGLSASADRATYFMGNVEACTDTWHFGIDPCAKRSDFGFRGVTPSTSVLLDAPPTYEEVLMDSYGFYALDDVPEEILDTSVHLVVRGVFDARSTQCAGHPLLFHQWIFQPDASLAERSSAVPSADDFTFHHWSCFAVFSVHEYLVGQGPGKISVQYVDSGVPYDTSDTPSLDPYRVELESLRSQIAGAYEGIEWIAWLGPSYNATVESLTAYALWDVQKGEDGVVRVVSPDAAYYEETGVTGSALDRLQAPLTDFRRDIKAAQASRLRRTSGRIGVEKTTPMLVTDALKLSEYYEEAAAYDNPVATPAPPPTRPYAPTGLIVTRWTDPQPEVDLEWYAPPSSEVTSYKIVRIDSLGNETVIATALPGEFTETTDRDLPTAGTEYTYTVIAVNAHGESEPSGGASVRNGPPNPPTGLYVSLQPVNEADLEWKAPASSHVTGYRVERKTGNGAWVTLQDDILAEDLETSDWRLQSGTTYTYRVVAYNAWTESAPSAEYTLHVP